MLRGNLLWGVILLTAGVLLLLDRTGLLETIGIGDISVWNLIWPLALILIGVWIVAGSIPGSRAGSVEELSIPVGGANEGIIHLRHAAGRLAIHALETPSALLSGTFIGGVEHRQHRSAGRLEAELWVPSRTFFPLSLTRGSRPTAEWSVGLHPALPITLRLESGAGENLLDLRSLQIKELRIQTGASSTHLNLPADAGRTRVSIDSGAASVKVRVPPEVAARIETRSGLSSVMVDTARFPRQGEIYQSPEFAEAGNRVEIDVKMGVGSIDIR